MVGRDDVVLRMVRMVLDDQMMDMDRMVGVRGGDDDDGVQMGKVDMGHMEVHDDDVHRMGMVRMVGKVHGMDHMVRMEVHDGGDGVVLHKVRMVLDGQMVDMGQIVHMVGMVDDCDDDVHQMDLGGRMDPMVGKVHGMVHMEVHDGDDGVVLHMVRMILDGQMMDMGQMGRIVGMVDDCGGVCVLCMVQMVRGLRMMGMGQMGRMVDVRGGGDDDDGVFLLANNLLVLVHSKIVHGNDDVFFFLQMENLIGIDNQNLVLNDDGVFFHTFLK